MWRHGDVLIATIANTPDNSRKMPTTILLRGEITGHSHRVEDPATAVLWEKNNQIYLQVIAETARLIHEEHKPITLPKGYYRIWQQREYTPRAILTVID